ncbi:MAG: OmpA family protein [Bacteroidales bacterium]|nr:OmpA family protein [Bacteroidales bacterium]
MKKRTFAVYAICGSLLMSSCGTLNNTEKGMMIGGSSGAAAGAGLGALIGKDGKGAAIGAAIGAVVGTGAGALIGKKMDKKKAELESIQGATVETVTDANNLQAVKVTFESGILFATNSSTLSAQSKKALSDFAAKMKDMPDTDLTIQGHTDNTGSRAINESLSQKRAEAVGKYLRALSIAGSRISEEGLAYDVPVADNSTAEGRAQNRRVEIYITANETMIKKAEAGNL